MKKYCLTDLDNSVLDFAPHFEEWASKSGYEIRRGVINQSYNLQDMFCDSSIVIEKVLETFFACDHTMSNFPALADTIEPMQRLHERGYDFVGISACNPRERLAELRHDNLTKLLGFEFEEVFITGYDLPKATILKNYEPTYWVEDIKHHAEEGARLGHTVFLVDHPYNKGEGPFTRVKNWQEIESIIK